MKEEYVAADTNGLRRPLFYRYVSWSAIIAGLVVALVTQILLTLLGVAIGAATVQPMQERNPVEGLGIGAGIWWFVTGLISLFLGAFVAGRLAGVARKKNGALHGFLMWSTATVVTFMVAGTMMGGVFGTGAFSAISEPGNRRQIMNELDEKKDHMGIGEQSRVGTDNDTDYDEVNRMGSDVDYDRTSPASPYHSPTTTDQANRIDGRDPGDTRAGGNTHLLEGENDPATVGGAEADDEERVVVGSQEEARLRETGEKVAGTASRAALMGLFVLLIGAGVCAWAGSKGAPHDYVPPREHDSRVPGHAIPSEPLKG